MLERSTHARRLASRRTWWLASSVVLVFVLSSCARFTGDDAEDTIERPEWVARTGRLLDQSVQVEGGAAFMMASTYEAADVYVMAQAISGLGAQAGPILESYGLDELSDRLDRGMQQPEAAAALVGPVYVARELSRANEIVDDLLTDAQLEVLRRTVDDALKDRSPEGDVFGLLSVVETSRSLMYKVSQVEAWAIAAGLDPDCRSTQDLAAVAAAVAIDVTALGSCSVEGVSNLWLEAVGHLEQRLSPEEPRVGLPDCVFLEGLARLNHELWPTDMQRQDTLVGIHDRFQQLLSEARVDDLLACVAVLRFSANLLNVDFNLPAFAVDYLTLVLRDGAEPWGVRLDQSGLATAIRAGRLVGVNLTIRVEDLAGDDVAQRLDLLLSVAEPDLGWTEEIERAAQGVSAAYAGEDSLAASVLMRALVQGGSDACNSPIIDIAEGLVDDLRTTGVLVGLSTAAQARAVRGLAECGRSTGGAEDILTQRAIAVLDRLGQSNQPGLLEAADAVEVLCALDPKSLPEQKARWDAYAADAASIGGAADEDLGVISIERTHALAIVAQSTAEECDATGKVTP